ncbi:beta-ketoacyl-[acyl-carrier-protein] synthase family protein [Pseudomonas botevensis]|uniref:beta-ketoacyl synthase n=1 Tax=Pseudomonas botevensis TaxID=2842352 RepID=UPI001C3D0E63|nr:beta-ketoacyl synthase [Pseudomonas botevensis]MBV4474708.1 beta-ketoacyl synthase [Pseudomonas botevensis]
MNRAIYINDAAILNAAGSECADLLGAPLNAQPLAFDARRQAFALPTPRLPGDLFDRKIQRSVEPQGLRLLHCAARLAPALAALDLPPARIALTAAIPEVDAPSPCWDAVQAIIEQPHKQLAQLLANTPPLHALTLLNSSVMAYVAEALNCHGPMGGFCSQDNAGLDALIEACQQIGEQNAEAALVVSSSPNLTPALYLREPGLASEPVFGEGAAALLLSSTPSQDATQTLRIAGFARGYSADPQRAEAVGRRVIDQALSREKLCLGDVGRIVGNPDDPQLNELFAASSQALGSTRGMTGELGASGLLTEVALSLHHARQSAATPGYTLLVSHTRAGHWGALLLASETMEKHA